MNRKNEISETIDGHYITYNGPMFPAVPEPEYAGYYEVGKGGGLRIMLQKKPSWVTRTMTRVLLEWYWVSENKETLKK